MAATKHDHKKHDIERETEDALSVYEHYGKPLEQQHAGEFLAVSKDGKTLLGKDLLELTTQATQTFGSGNYVFKIGEIAVGKWLWLSRS